MRKTDEQFVINEALDEVYAAGPGEAAIQQAQARLKQALADAALYYGRVEGTPIGTVFVALHARGLVAVDFGVREADFAARLERDFGVPVEYSREETRQACQQIGDYLTGARPSFDLPLDIGALTDFQQQVLRATLQIPRGQTVTYNDIAHKIRNPKAVRAVGQALGRNPIPLVIPCHRVVASSGKLGGYSGGGGLATKQALLALEGAALL